MFLSVAAVGAKVHKSGNNVEGKCGHDEFAVSDFIGNHTANNNSKAETGEPGSPDRAQLNGSETKFPAPVIQNSAANRETDARSEDRHEAGPEEAPGVGCECCRVTHKVRFE